MSCGVLSIEYFIFSVFSYFQFFNFLFLENIFTYVSFFIFWQILYHREMPYVNFDFWGDVSGFSRFLFLDPCCRPHFLTIFVLFAFSLYSFPQHKVVGLLNSLAHTRRRHCWISSFSTHQIKRGDIVVIVVVLLDPSLAAFCYKFCPLAVFCY